MMAILGLSFKAVAGLLWVLATLAVADRVDDQAGFLVVTESWCVQEGKVADHVLTCPEGSKVKVLSGAYNKVKRKGCPDDWKAPSPKMVEGCPFFDVEALKKLCDGKQCCLVPSTWHRDCVMKSYLHMSLRYDCVSDETTDIATVDQSREAAQAACTAQGEVVAEKAAAQGLVVAENAASQKGSVTAIQAIAKLKMRVRKQAPPGASLESAVNAVLTPEETKEEVLEDNPELQKQAGDGASIAVTPPETTQKVLEDNPKLPTEDGDGASDFTIHEHVAQPMPVIPSLEDPNVEIITASDESPSICFKTCWRKIPFWDEGPRQTCGVGEDCYALSFKGDNQRMDPSKPPTPDELVSASLVTSDWFVMPWFGLGLTRNWFRTWGICFPEVKSRWRVSAEEQNQVISQAITIFAAAKAAHNESPGSTSCGTPLKK